MAIQRTAVLEVILCSVARLAGEHFPKRKAQLESRAITR